MTVMSAKEGLDCPVTRREIVDEATWQSVARRSSGLKAYRVLWANTAIMRFWAGASLILLDRRAMRGEFARWDKLPEPARCKPGWLAARLERGVGVRRLTVLVEDSRAEDLSGL